MDTADLVQGVARGEWSAPFDTSLTACLSQNLGLVPWPVMARLESLLLSLKEQTGLATSRKTLVAATLLYGSADIQELDRWVRGFTNATAGQAFVGAPPADRVLRYRPAGSGRR